MNRNDLKVGQKVRLVDNRDKMGSKIAMGWDSSMVNCFGNVVTIEMIKYDSGRNLDYIRAEENKWSWDIRLLEVVEESKPVIYGKYDFLEVDKILPMNVLLTKVIHNKNAVIVFAKENKTGKIYKAVSKCDAEDTFDIDAGVRLGAYKILRKIAFDGLKKFK